MTKSTRLNIDGESSSHWTTEPFCKYWGRQQRPGSGRDFKGQNSLPQRDRLSINGLKATTLKSCALSTRHSTECSLTSKRTAIGWMRGVIAQNPRINVRAAIASLVNAAPRLIPVIGHRYLAHAPAAPRGYIVLSVVQTDIITYGSELRSFLLNELSELVGTWIDYKQLVAGITGDMTRSIPFWGKLVG